MRTDERLKTIYETAARMIMRNESAWKDFLSFTARIHKHSFDNALLVYRVKQHKGIYARMAWILRNSGNGHAYEAMERVVAKKNTNVYLETMEEAENKDGKPKEIGYARMASLPQRKHSQRLLGYCRKWYITYHNNKRKTCT